MRLPIKVQWLGAASEERPYEIEPWRKLWGAVLYQAVYDRFCLGAGTNTHTPRQGKTARACAAEHVKTTLHRIRDEADAWIKSDTQGFVEICEALDLDPAVLRKGILAADQERLRKRIKWGANPDRGYEIFRKEESDGEHEMSEARCS